MEEHPKKLEAKKDSPIKAQKRRKRVTVAEKLVERKNRANNQLGGPRQEKSAKNGDKRGEMSGKEMGTKGKRDGRIGQSNSAECHHLERRFDSRIPDRWLFYQIAINQPIEKTPFLAFKTPLGALFFDKKYGDRQQHRFEVDTVIEHVNSLEKSLGLVIDLTNTDRYYDCGLWSKHEVKYVKIRCPGHEVNESEGFYQQFRKEVKQFVDQHENSGKLVGVHCTHGLNRTGYLICRFLIEELGWSAIDAIECFRIARGYPMERPKYIDSLKEVEKNLSLVQVDEDCAIN
ncbi:hypothetical protein niasHT_016292 [Heterodera trifolii]|uniref:RNA/RNP complex-1-interacting phosphatase n=1 Tax=Heterodera trifolii TaxID=157864 RepID=A0ABD2LHJ1_9BILA